MKGHLQFKFTLFIFQEKPDGEDWTFTCEEGNDQCDANILQVNIYDPNYVTNRYSPNYATTMYVTNYAIYMNRTNYFTMLLLCIILTMLVVGMVLSMLPI